MLSYQNYSLLPLSPPLTDKRQGSIVIFDETRYSQLATTAPQPPTAVLQYC